MAVIWRGSPNYTPGSQTQAAYGVPRVVRKIIIHWIVGNLASADAAFQSPARQASAHYGVEEDTIYQWVHEHDTAWHAGNQINAQSIGIENSAAPGRPASDRTYATLAALVADICKRYGLNPFTDIEPHNKYYATQCPGTMDLQRIAREASAIMLGGEMFNGKTAQQWYEHFRTTNRELARLAYLLYLLRGVSPDDYTLRQDILDPVAVENEIAKSDEAFKAWKLANDKLGLKLTDDQIRAKMNDFWHNAPGLAISTYTPPAGSSTPSGIDPETKAKIEETNQIVKSIQAVVNWIRDKLASIYK